MSQYPPFTTTVVGAHSVPRWYEPLDRLVALGQLAEGDFADAQLRASQAAILEQEIAGAAADDPLRQLAGEPRVRTLLESMRLPNSA